jgi:hypothetical protein
MSVSSSMSAGKRGFDQTLRQSNPSDTGNCRRLIAAIDALKFDFNQLNPAQFVSEVWTKLSTDRPVLDVQIQHKTFVIKLPSPIFTLLRFNVVGRMNCKVTDAPSENLANRVWWQKYNNLFAEVKCLVSTSTGLTSLQFRLPQAMIDYRSKKGTDLYKTIKKMIEMFEGALEEFVHPDYLQNYKCNGVSGTFVYVRSASSKIRFTLERRAPELPRAKTIKKPRHIIPTEPVKVSYTSEEVLNICQRMRFLSELLSGRLEQIHQEWFYELSWNRLIERQQLNRLVTLGSLVNNRLILKVDTAFLHYHVMGTKIGYATEGSFRAMKWVAELHPMEQAWVSQFLQESHNVFAPVQLAVAGPHYQTLSVTLPFLPEEEFTLLQIATLYRRILTTYLPEDELRDIDRDGFQSLMELRTNYVPFPTSVSDTIMTR